MVDSLQAIGDLITEQDHIDAVLEGLPEEYNSFVMMIYSRPDSPSITEIEGLLLVQEAQLDKYRQELASVPVSANVAQTSSKSETLGVIVPMLLTMIIPPLVQVVAKGEVIEVAAVAGAVEVTVLHANFVTSMGMRLLTVGIALIKLLFLNLHFSTIPITGLLHNHRVHIWLCSNHSSISHPRGTCTTGLCIPDVVPRLGC